MGRLFYLALAAALTLFLMAAPADAARKRKANAKDAPKRLLVLFPIVVSEDANVELTRAIDAAVERGAHGAYPQLLGGETLNAKLNGDSLEKCKGDIPCIAKLGKRLKADDVFLGNATAHGAGVSVAAVVISVARTKVEGKAMIAVASPADVEAAVKGAFFDLFHLPHPDAMAAMASLELGESSDSDADALELAPIAFASPPAATDPKASTPTDDDTAELVAIPTSPRATSASPAPATQPAAAGNKSPSRWLTYTGLGVVALGAAVACSGILPSRAARDSYDKGDNLTLDQFATTKLQKDGDRAIDRANQLFVIGGGLAALGGALALLDLVLLSDVEPTLAVTTHGVRASISVAF